MARTSSAKGWRPSYSKRAVRKRMINFIALGSYNADIRSSWQPGGAHWEWAKSKSGLWRDAMLTYADDEKACLRAARDWEKRNNGST
jgi:hypothetical protein